MNKKTFTLPRFFAAWIEKNMKGVKLKEVQLFGVDKLPVNFIPGFSYAFAGMALLDKIYIRNKFLPLNLNDPRTMRLIIHELVHVQQVKRMGIFGFIFNYLWNLRKGYYNHPLEIEAYSEEKRLYNKFLQDQKLRVAA